MARTFRAQSLAQTKTSKDQRSFEMTFVDAAGAKRTISMPVQMAADLRARAERAGRRRGALQPARSSPRFPRNGRWAAPSMSGWC